MTTAQPAPASCFFDISNPSVDVDGVNIDHVNIVNMARREKIPEHSTEQRDTYHHGDLKRALTEAALGLVKEKGPKGFTLREVARRAGVSAAAPYRHFSDKAQLLAAVATLGFVQLHETLSAVAAETADLTQQVLGHGTGVCALGRHPPRLLPGDVRLRAGQE